MHPRAKSCGRKFAPFSDLSYSSLRNSLAQRSPWEMPKLLPRANGKLRLTWSCFMQPSTGCLFAAPIWRGRLQGSSLLIYLFSCSPKQFLSHVKMFWPAIMTSQKPSACSVDDQDLEAQAAGPSTLSPPYANPNNDRLRRTEPPPPLHPSQTQPIPFSAVLDVLRPNQPILSFHHPPPSLDSECYPFAHFLFAFSLFLVVPILNTDALKHIYGEHVRMRQLVCTTGPAAATYLFMYHQSKGLKKMISQSTYHTVSPMLFTVTFLAFIFSGAFDP